MKVTSIQIISCSLEDVRAREGKKVFCYHLDFNDEETGNRVYMVVARVAMGRWQEYYVSLHPGAAEFIANIANMNIYAMIRA